MIAQKKKLLTQKNLLLNRTKKVCKGSKIVIHIDEEVNWEYDKKKKNRRAFKRLYSIEISFLKNFL